MPVFFLYTIVLPQTTIMDYTAYPTVPRRTLPEYRTLCTCQWLGFVRFTIRWERERAEKSRTRVDFNPDPDNKTKFTAILFNSSTSFRLSTRSSIIVHGATSQGSKSCILICVTCFVLVGFKELVLVFFVPLACFHFLKI